MKLKVFNLTILIIASILIFSGCVETNSTVANNTSIVNDNNVPVEQPNTSNSVESNDTQIDINDDLPKSYTIHMRNYLLVPNYVEINSKDTVIWYNNNDPKRLFTLISHDRLWENTTINYKQRFSYTFNDTGTYNYSVLGYPRMSGTITVK